MSDELMKVMRDQGFDTEEKVIEHLKTVKAAEDAAKKGDRENYDKAIEDVVAAQLKAMMGKVTPKIGEGEAASGTPIDAEVKELKDELWFVGQLTRKAPKTLDPDIIRAGFRAHRGKTYDMASIRKAMDTTDMSTIVPMDMARALLSDIEKQNIIAANLRTMTMPTNPWEAPYQSSNITVYGVDENTDDAGDAVGASPVSYTHLTLPTIYSV